MKTARLAGAVALALVLSSPEANAGHEGVTRTVSLGDTDVQGNGQSIRPAVSADGRFVAFDSWACNLLGSPTRQIGTHLCSVDDTNSDNRQFPDVFVRDRDTDRDGIMDEPGATSTERVSIGASEPNEASYDPSISEDGRFVAFTSEASNLVPGDTNGAMDVFVHDRSTRQTVRVSVRTDGSQGDPGQHSFEPSISPDGAVVAFTTEAALAPADEGGLPDVYYRDRDADRDRVFDEPGDIVTGKASVPSQDGVGEEADGESSTPAVSRFGDVIAFTSCAENLVPPARDGNGKCDVFVRRPATRRTEIVSAGLDGSGNDHSGRPPELECTSRPHACGHLDSAFVSISPGGEAVAFTSLASDLDPLVEDRNGAADVYLRELSCPRPDTVLVSVEPDGRTGYGPSFDPALGAVRSPIGSAGGCGTGAYVSVAFVTGAIECYPYQCRVLCAFAPCDEGSAHDVYVRDLVLGPAGRTAGTTARASFSSQGAEGNSHSQGAALSHDGRYVIFWSEATNLKVPDENRAHDVFARDRYACTGGIAEEGPASSLVHGSAEPQAGPARPTVHDLNCALELRLGDLW